MVEDAAQSQGARRNGAGAGALGHAAATSFYPGKNLGAYGDAGAVLTGSAEVAARMRMIRDHGSARKYEHEVLGVNSRLDTLQAVVLSAKLRQLAGWNAARRAAAQRYDTLLAGMDEVVSGRRPWTATSTSGISTWSGFPTGTGSSRNCTQPGSGPASTTRCPFTSPRRSPASDTPEGAFPVAEQAAQELLSLPLFAEITAEQQEQRGTGARSRRCGRRKREGRSGGGCPGAGPPGPVAVAVAPWSARGGCGGRRARSDPAQPEREHGQRSDPGRRQRAGPVTSPPVTQSASSSRHRAEGSSHGAKPVLRS